MRNTRLDVESTVRSVFLRMLGYMTRPLRILCVEDQEILGDVMLCLLSQAGHWVEHVTDGIDAWDRISQDIANFDVVVTGHLMPRLNGLELVELLHEATFPGKIILYTAGLSPAVRERYRSLGVLAIIEKSTRAEELLDAISSARLSPAVAPELR